MEKALNLLDRLQATWESKNPLSVLLLIALSTLVGVASAYLVDWSQTDLSKVIKNWSVLTLLGISLFSLVTIAQFSWFLSIRPRKVSPNKIGLLFAIETENKTQKKLVQQNFARDFAKIALSNADQDYSVQFIADYYTKKITADRKWATRIINKANGNLILYGRIEERKKDGNDVYVLSFDETVRHRPISLEESKGFGREMRSIIPTETLFPVSDEYNGFTFSSRIVGLGSKYILGIAAFYSGSLDLALALLVDSQRLCLEVLSVYSNESGAKQIQKRLPQVVVRVCRRGATVKTLHEKDFGGGLVWANRGLSVDPNDYECNLLASTCLFRLGNVADSIKRIEVASTNTKDYTWAWSKAFLMAYSGRLQEAYELYKFVANRPAVANAASQCEIFIAETLEQDPELVQFYYCLGLINLLVKEDWKLAAEFFETFAAECAKRGIHAEFREHALRYVERCKEQGVTS